MRYTLEFKLKYLLKAANMGKSTFYFEISKKDVVAEKSQVLTQEIQEIFDSVKTFL